jgi:hypothetical protein
MKQRVKAQHSPSVAGLGLAAAAAAAVLGTSPSLASPNVSTDAVLSAQRPSNPLGSAVTRGPADFNASHDDAALERTFYDWVHFNVFKTQVAGSTVVT